MKWTKETPTKPGAYWWRLNKDTDHVRCVREVFLTKSGVLIERYTDRRPKDVGGEWCGPLVPAEEVEKVYKDGYREAYEAASETCSTPGPGHLESSWISYRARRVVEGGGSVNTISGRLVEAGDDETGQPRLIIEATRETIKAAAGNLLYRDVTVVIQQAGPQTPQLIATKCCACQRIKTTEGTYASLYDLAMPPGVTYSHGYCPDCEAKAWAELNALLPEKKEVDGAGEGGSVAVCDR